MVQSMNETVNYGTLITNDKIELIYIKNFVPFHTTV